MLYKLSFSNIKKSFKDYAIYFLTLILGVCIFYVFNSLDSQTAMIDVSSSTSSIIELIVTVINYLSIFVAFVLGLLIIYASRFLIKKRNKEFGVYLTLGMSKRKVSKLLLIETFLIGLISLVLGLAIGILVSQVTSIFVAKLFEANMSSFTFVFSKSALVKTIIYFGVIYFVVMIFNTVNINRSKLIDLLQGSKKAEQIKLKNSVLSIILFILSIVFLGVAYYLVTDGFFEILYKYELGIIALPISLGVIGTILFFYSVAGMLLKIISKFKNVYYKGLNSFIFKNISSKINTMVVSVSMICIMLFFTICLLASALSIKNFYNDRLRNYAPCDFNIFDYVDKSDTYLSKEELIGLINNNSYIKNNTKDVNLITVYYDHNFLYKDSLGNIYDSIYEQFPYLSYDEDVEIIKLSDYRKIAKLYNLKTFTLEKDEYQIVSNYDSNIYDNVMKSNSIYSIFGYNLRPHSNSVVDGFLAINGNPSNLGFIVVNDYVIEDLYYDYLLIGNYKYDDENINKEIEKIFSGYEETGEVSVETITKIKDNSVGLSALVTFVGLYLGIIFLISSAAILSLKELSDSLDDIDKYRMLRNIGTDEAMINKAIFKQTLIFFMLPLSLALIHTIFGIKFCLIILSSIGIDSLSNSIITTGMFIVFIYGGYFLITFLCNKNIIREKN